jgi:hypothetical protein
MVTKSLLHQQYHMHLLKQFLPFPLINPIQLRHKLDHSQSLFNEVWEKILSILLYELIELTYCWFQLSD